MMDFAAEAERRRRAGDAHAALAIAEEGLAADPANHPGRVALALALLDLGDFQRAREQLEMAVPGAPEAASGMMPSESGSLGDDLGEDELESAFAHAETNPDEMLSANKVVEQTLAHEHVEVPEVAFDVTESPTYATETMASLLEGQGRVGDAETLRESFVHSEPGFLEDDYAGAAAGSDVGPGPDFEFDASPMTAAEGIGLDVGADHADRVRIVATLESWLYNLRQGGAHESREGRRTAEGLSSS